MNKKLYYFMHKVLCCVTVSFAVDMLLSAMILYTYRPLHFLVYFCSRTLFSTFC